MGDVDGPDALVPVKYRPGYLDLAHLRGADRTEVARIPHDEQASIWQPKVVTFHFYGSVLASLLALKRLPDPGLAAAPRLPYEPPRDSTPTPLTVADAERASVTIRPPARHTNSEGGMPMSYERPPGHS